MWISTIALSCSLRPPDIYYVTDHYGPYNVVLVRLSRLNRDMLRDLFGMAHKFCDPKRQLGSAESSLQENE